MVAAKMTNAMEVAKEEAPEENHRSSHIHSSSLAVHHSLPLSDMKPRIVELFKDLFKNWSKLDDSHFSVQTVAGGITNLLLKVSVREENGDVVDMTVRLYGPNTEFVIDRERELQAIQYLSAAGFGAKLLGVFTNGMVQSFINARTLTPSDMRKPKIAAEIAKQLRAFHKVEVPGSKEPQLWNDMFKFFEKASTLEFDDSEKQQKYETISFKGVHTEIIELKELTDRLNSPVVFSHNDLLSGNLMLNDDEDKLYFIDFEYGSYSYRGFDIGNHFSEYAGYDCDYSLYPSKDEQFHFFRHYLEPDRPYEVRGNGKLIAYVFTMGFQFDNPLCELSSHLLDQAHACAPITRKGIYLKACFLKVSDKDLEALYAETNAYMLASHLYWALWALIQAKMSPIDFDYLRYFFLRYDEFKKQKEKCLLLAQSYTSG
ncbi:unnamed protein product [Ilex paraguariensis]|uniref:ethanolamine kinase n=1 Tax=Ilex paraguariensis TaxID=185542 RepID=A0ABC8UMF0_9AQUA